MMKKRRHKLILDLINRYDIGTQDELLALLRDEGCDVTQATVSRDLKELKLTKVQTARGTYRYAVSQARQSVGNVKLFLCTSYCNVAKASFFFHFLHIADCTHAREQAIFKTY